MGRQVEWQNANRYRRYPFIENSDLGAGALTVGDDVIVAFRGVSYVLEGTDVHLSQFEIVVPGSGPRVGNFTFTYAGAIAPFDTIVFSVPENAAFPYAAVVQDSAVQHVTCVFGDAVADLLQNAAGTYVMDDPPQVEPALVGFQPRHRVTSLIASGTGQDTLTGEVHLEEGYNCQVAIDTDRSRVTVNGVRGGGAGISCDRLDPDVILCTEALLRLNGLRAGDLGDFMFVAGDGAEVIPDPDNHRIIVRSTTPPDELECG